ncbi:hypothetical protein HGRIS_006247 [Hohenbuehelia grisea]|uniref:Ion transport domain-containing protein n=1 Tax=Hohenbuehelia grisea TaxID=104357 RepID=A0ABR3JZK9_9AGAR
MSNSIPLREFSTDDDARKFLTERSRSPSPHDVNDIFPHQPSFEDSLVALDDIHPPWKRDLYALMERPTSSPSAVLIHILTTGLIVLSAIVTILETVPSFHYISTRFWFGLETSIVILFTVEYVLRAVAHSSSWSVLFKWATSFFAIVDLLAIFPYYVEILLQQDTSVLFRFSILRMFRLLRVFRPFRYNNTILLTIEVMYISIRRSQHALLAISFFVSMALTVFSTLLYFAERGTWDNTLETFVNVDGDPSQFASIPAAAWFVMVSITTVGYGEITPRSFLGRLITLPLLVFGLLLIALPSFVLGREFSIVWEKMTRHQREGKDVVTPLTATYPIPFGPSTSYEQRPRDLSNLKLAENQTELSKQISDLRGTMEMQAKLIKRLVGALEAGSKGKQRETLDS